MPQIAPPKVQAAAAPSVSSPAAHPLKPPPASAAPATKGSISPVVWIVALVAGVMGIGAIFVTVLLVGVAVLLMFKASPAKAPPMAKSPAMLEDYGKSAPTYTSGSSDYWSQSKSPAASPPSSGSTSGYERYYDKAASNPPAALSSVPPGSGAAQEAYREPAQDPDWQFNLPEYQRDAIRDLNDQRERGP